MLQPRTFLGLTCLCLFGGSLSAQDLVLRLERIPDSSTGAQISIDAGGATVYETQIEFAQRIGHIERAIAVPVGTNYRVRVTALKGKGKLQLILAAGMAQGIDVPGGQSQALTIALMVPVAELSFGGTNVQRRSVTLKYSDAAGLVNAGEYATLWCREKNDHINTGGQQVLAPWWPDPGSSYMYASFTIPDTDGFTYCQAGYYLPESTMSARIPFFVYPDLDAGNSPVEVPRRVSPQFQRAQRLDIPRSSVPAGAARTPEPSASDATGLQSARAPIRVGADGRLERATGTIKSR